MTKPKHALHGSALRTYLAGWSSHKGPLNHKEKQSYVKPSSVESAHGNRSCEESPAMP